MTDRYGQQGGNNVARGGNLQFNQRASGEPLRVLSEDDWRFWRENGYVIVPNAAPRENLEAVIDLLWDFQEMDRNDPATWNRQPARRIGMAELNGSGMVEIYNLMMLERAMSQVNARINHGDDG
jgi:hypothetical protein